jgi:hypothetical protein
MNGAANDGPNAPASKDSSGPASPAPPPQTPVKPGGIRITQRPPDATNWIVTRVNPNKVTYTCRPLACAAHTIVNVTTAPTAVRNINAAALERFAKVDFPKQLKAMNAAAAVLAGNGATIETLVAKPATILGRSAVVNESKYTSGRKVVFISTTLLFAGPVMLTVQSLSGDRAAAVQYLNDTIAQLKLEDGPPAKPAPVPGRPQDGRA